MSLSLEEVKNIANLARLQLTPEELENYRSQLSEILDYFEIITDLDTSEVTPNPCYLKSDSTQRIDESIPGINIKDLMKNAVKVDEDQFSVPPIFD